MNTPRRHDKSSSVRQWQGGAGALILYTVCMLNNLCYIIYTNYTQAMLL